MESADRPVTVRPPAAGASETALEALRVLAHRRLPPVPENYSAVFHELAGGASPAVEHPAARALAEVAAAAAGGPGRAGRPLARAVARGEWESAGRLLGSLLAARERAPRWATLLRGLLRQLDARHAGLTTARKREALEHVLETFEADDERLHARLSGLAQSWKLTQLSPAPDPGLPAGDAGPEKSAPQATGVAAHEPGRGWPGLLAEALEALGRARDGAVDAEIRTLAAKCRAMPPNGEAKAIAPAVRRLGMRREALAGECEEVARGLASLLRLLVENVGELVADDRWLRGQTEALRALLEGRVDRARLREAERSLRAVIYKQSARKLSLDQAQRAFKDMVAAFVAGLEEMSRATGQYESRVADHRRRMEQAEDLGQLSRVVEALLDDTRLLQADVVRRREHVQAQRASAVANEVRVRNLEGELERMSERAREDPLAALLDGRGIEQALGVEEARAARTGEPYCVALLDIDHFKRLNDAHGAAAGEQALGHLARVVRETLRPTDLVARCGDEAFMIVLPQAGEAEAAAMLVRVQRELTRRFFLANDERVFVTFSAGVCERRAGESREDLLDRADRALHAAQRAGRNRVEAAGTAV